MDKQSKALETDRGGEQRGGNADPAATAAKFHDELFHSTKPAGGSKFRAPVNPDDKSGGGRAEPKGETSVEQREKDFQLRYSIDDLLKDPATLTEKAWHGDNRADLVKALKNKLEGAKISVETGDNFVLKFPSNQRQYTELTIDSKTGATTAFKINEEADGKSRKGELIDDKRAIKMMSLATRIFDPENSPHFEHSLKQILDDESKNVGRPQAFKDVIDTMQSVLQAKGGRDFSVAYLDENGKPVADQKNLLTACGFELSYKNENGKQAALKTQKPEKLDFWRGNAVAMTMLSAPGSRFQLPEPHLGNLRLIGKDCISDKHEQSLARQIDELKHPFSGTLGDNRIKLKLQTSDKESIELNVPLNHYSEQIKAVKTTKSDDGRSFKSETIDEQAAINRFESVRALAHCDWKNIPNQADPNIALLMKNNIKYMGRELGYKETLESIGIAAKANGYNFIGAQFSGLDDKTIQKEPGDFAAVRGCTLTFEDVKHRRYESTFSEAVLAKKEADEAKARQLQFGFTNPGKFFQTGGGDLRLDPKTRDESLQRELDKALERLDRLERLNKMK